MGHSMAIDRIGLRYGRLIVTARAENTQGPPVAARWHCRCDCGKTSVVRGRLLGNGDTQSCGCLMVERVIAANTTHGMSPRGPRTPTYRSWRAMKNRCGNSNHADWPRYGGRGIDIDPRWVASFEAFLADMGERPDGLSIDRIDNERGYWPDNCRWATLIEQRNNQRPRGRRVA